MVDPEDSAVAGTRFDRDSFEAFRVLPWQIEGSAILLHYSLDDVLSFTETVTLPVAVDQATPGVPEAINLLAAAAGVSYFKVAAPRVLSVETGPLTAASTAFVSLLYDHGLREFAYRNRLDVPLRTTLKVSGAPQRLASQASDRTPHQRSRALLPMGGGRDSGLVASVLAPLQPLLLSVSPNRYVDGLAEFLGLETATVGRKLSPNIGELNRTVALNGHIPVTAINWLISIVAALHLGCDSVVMANESSASSPTIITADGVEVNHQFSKSLLAERALAEALEAEGVPLRTYSAVRPWGELAIARAFAHRPELFNRIMSCNRAFVRDPLLRSDGWCGACAKCRFVYLTLAPFTTRDQLTEMFGQDLLASAAGEDHEGFAALLREDRPFDCVGEVGEARLAVALLAQSPQWQAHPIVRSLAANVPKVDAASLSATLAELDDHAVPPDVLARMRQAFL